MSHVCQLCHTPFPDGTTRNRKYCHRCSVIVNEKSWKLKNQNQSQQQLAFMANISRPLLTIKVIDPLLAKPYMISQLDYEQYREAFEAMPDVQLIFP
jgi:hypothetical protein